MTQKTAANAKLLLNEILKIPGDKIVTLTTLNGTFQVDVNKEGRIGYEEGIEQLLLAKLVNAIGNGGGLIIRQFLTIRVQREMPNGKKTWVPEKNIYGVLLGRGTWQGCSSEETRSFHNTDATTGEALVEEQGVHFLDFGSSTGPSS